MKITLRLDGLKDLEKGLADLPKTTRRNVIRRGLQRSLEPMAEDARRRAPKREGKMAESIIVGTKLKKPSAAPGGTQKVMTDKGIRTSGGNFEWTDKGWRRRASGGIVVFMGPTSSLAHLQELGTAHHPAQPFMRPAYDAGKQAALDDFQKYLTDEVEKARARIARKAARLAAKAKRNR